MEDNQLPPAPSTEATPQKPEKRPLWDLSRDDQRLLGITFVGGLASIVAGFIVLGGAIALVRGLRAIHHPLGWLIFLIILTVVDIIVMIWGFKARRDLPSPWPPKTFITWLSFWVGSSILLLVWLGLAAGIH